MANKKSLRGTIGPYAPRLSARASTSSSTASTSRPRTHKRVFCEICLIVLLQGLFGNWESALTAGDAPAKIQGLTDEELNKLREELWQTFPGLKVCALRAPCSNLLNA
jgi:hypothetical protein